MPLPEVATAPSWFVRTTTGAAGSSPAGTSTTTSLSLTAISFVTRFPPTVTPSRRSSTAAVAGSSGKASTPVKPAPRTDTTVPPAVGPVAALTAVTSGATRKLVLAVPPVVSTETVVGPPGSPAGTSTVIDSCVGSGSARGLAALLPKNTLGALTPSRWVPLMTTSSPGLPDCTDRALMVGACSTVTTTIPVDRKSVV